MFDVGVRLRREGEAPAEPLTRVDVPPGSRLSRSFALPFGNVAFPHRRPRPILRRESGGSMSPWVPTHGKMHTIDPAAKAVTDTQRVI